MNRALWRVFVPTWRFFDRVGPCPKLFVRESEAEEWRPVETPIFRNWRSIVFAPENNFGHANRNLLDRLISEINDDVNLEASVTWKLVLRLAAARVGTESFQLKVTAAGEDVVFAPDARR